MIITEQAIHTMNQVENVHENIHQNSTLSIRSLSPLDAGSNSRQLSSLLHIICFNSRSLWLFSGHHLSHLFSTHLSSLSTSLTSSVTSTFLVTLSSSLSHRLSFVPASLESSLASSSSLTTRRTSHRHIIFPSSLRRMSSDNHRMSSCYHLSFDTAPPPPIPNFHDPFVRIQWTVPYHVIIRTSACEHQNQSAMIRSMSWYKP